MIYDALFRSFRFEQSHSSIQVVRRKCEHFVASYGCLRTGRSSGIQFLQGNQHAVSWTKMIGVAEIVCSKAFIEAFYLWIKFFLTRHELHVHFSKRVYKALSSFFVHYFAKPPRAGNRNVGMVFLVDQISYFGFLSLLNLVCSICS